MLRIFRATVISRRASASCRSASKSFTNRSPKFRTGRSCSMRFAVNDKFPERHRRLLKWLERCRERGLKIYGQSATVEAGFAFTFADWNLWEDVPAWKEATLGNFEARLQKLGDPERRPGLRDIAPFLTNDWKDTPGMGTSDCTI